MRIDKLRTAVGILFILTHFGAILYVLLGIRPYIKTSETIEIALILSPLFSAYTAAIVKKFLDSPHARLRGKIVNAPYIFVAVFFPVVFGILIFSVLRQFQTGAIGAVEDLRQYLAACETMAGAYLGLVMGNMFDVPEAKISSAD